MFVLSNCSNRWEVMKGRGCVKRIHRERKEEFNSKENSILNKERKNQVRE